MPTSIRIRPWTDPVIDTIGHDPRSLYVETFWLPTLGPTCLLLLRHLADRFDRSPEGIDLLVADTAQALGLGPRDGSSSPVVRSLTRLAQFDLACDLDSETVAVRRHVPPVNRRHVRRLPPALQSAHADWVDSQLEAPAAEPARARARRIAFTLLEQGDDPDHVERVLHGVGFHPALCRDSAQWAYERHRTALDVVRDRAAAEPEPAA